MKMYIISLSLFLVASNLSAMRTPMKVNASLVAKTSFYSRPKRQISFKNAAQITAAAATAGVLGYYGAKYGESSLTDQILVFKGQINIHDNNSGKNLNINAKFPVMPVCSSIISSLAGAVATSKYLKASEKDFVNLVKK